eukprot:TRINITY_DN8288_c0_g1_i1.p1 TRINITY_DN8288_c0_g1~~TRINITY_DN8288_c0_g1_i1.p1  ORF type:complete len:775 (-),score=167.60 TRINITY_DN8288_c0_g1_i1:99-2423(-)
MADICACDELQRRITKLENYIEIGAYLLELNNFSGTIEVSAGLESSAVHRLRRTWAGASAWHTARYAEFKPLVENRDALRRTLATTEPPCVPYVGLYATDLVFIEDGNKTFCGDNKVNFLKLRTLAKVLLELQRHKMAPYQLEEVPVLQQWLAKQGGDVSEAAVMQRSKQIEPREFCASNSGPLPPPVAAADSECTCVPVLFPAERAPTRMLVPLGYTFQQVADLLFSSWSGRQQQPPASPPPSSPPSPLPAQLPPPSLCCVHWRGCLRAAPAADYRLCVAFCGGIVGGAVQPAQTLGDFLVSCPKFAERSYFAMLADPKIVTAVYLTDTSCHEENVVISSSAPLSLALPLFESAFGLSPNTEFTLLHFSRSNSLVGRIPSTVTLREAQIPEDSTIALLTLESLKLKERVDFLLSQAGACVSRMVLLAGTPLDGFLHRKTKLGVPYCFLLLHEGLLYVINERMAACLRVLPLDCYDVALTRSPVALYAHRLCVVLTSITLADAEKTRLMVTCERECDVRWWFDKLWRQSRVNIQTKVFGLQLAPTRGVKMPAFLHKLFTLLYVRGVPSPDLFDRRQDRVSAELVTLLKFSINCGTTAYLDKYTDRYVAAELLCEYLDELPEPILTADLMPAFVAHLRSCSEGGPNLEALRALLSQLPRANFVVAACFTQLVRQWWLFQNPAGSRSPTELPTFPTALRTLARTLLFGEAAHAESEELQCLFDQLFVELVCFHPQVWQLRKPPAGTAAAPASPLSPLFSVQDKKRLEQLVAGRLRT